MRPEAFDVCQRLTVELHAGVAAHPRRVGDGAHQVARAMPLHRLAVDHGLGPPVLVVHHGLHEIVGHAHAVVGVLEKNRRVGLAVERRVVARVHQRVGLLLFLGLAPDEIVDVGVVRVEDHHLGGPARLAAGLDDAREGVEALHETQRPAGPAAAPQQTVFLAQRRQIRARPRAPLEQHALGFGEVEDRLQRVLYRVDEARRALRAMQRPVHLTDRFRGLVVVPTIAAVLFLHAHVEPHRRVEARLLVQRQVGQLGTEVFGIVERGEIAVVDAPLRDRVHDPMNDLRDAAFPLRRSHASMKILAGDDVGGRLRPVGRDLNVLLFKDEGPFVVADRSRAPLPAQFVVGRAPGGEFGRKIAWKTQSAALFLLEAAPVRRRLDSDFDTNLSHRPLLIDKQLSGEARPQPGQLYRFLQP